MSFAVTFGGANNFTNPPLFANLYAGDFHLNAASSCINAGNNSFITNSTDLDGNPRIVGGTVDLGAYEFQSPIRFVSVSNTAPVSPFTNWLTAATNIQDAIDVANAGDFIVVSNGTYNTGGRAVYGIATNRVTVDKAVTIQSVNGSAATIIAGLPDTGGYPSSGIRCVYLTNGAALIGFTLTNGATRSYGTDTLKEQSGAAVWCESTNAIISSCVLMHSYANYWGGGAYQGTLNNCTIAGNTAFISGGGTYSANLNDCVVSGNKLIQGSGGGGASFGTLNNCLITSNSVSACGGGAYYATLNGCSLSNNSALYGGGACFGLVNNCLVSSNRAYGGGGVCSNTLVNCLLKNNFATWGGGAFDGTLLNCTIISNTASGTGGGVNGGSLANCIIYYNSSPKIPDFPNDARSALNFCDSMLLATNGVGNITNEPAFVNLAGGDFHLQSNSPCINSGNNSYVTTTADLAGNPRIAGGTVDIGAYEYQTPTSVISYAWLQQYGLTNNGTADYTDSDGDHMNNWQEWKAGTIPTNAASVLQLSSPSNSVSGTTITWQSVSGVTYYLQRSTNLSAQPVFTTIQSNIVGQTGTTSYLDTTAAGHDLSIYRVGVQ
jgi:hypothetical protein